VQGKKVPALSGTVTLKSNAMRIRLSAVHVSSLLILLFAYTASSKLFDHPTFEATLSRTPFISPGAAILAWLVPLSELVLVLLLFFPQTRRAGLYCSIVLLLVFTVYLVAALLSGEHLPCSCGGVISGMSWGLHVAFNLVFIGLAYGSVVTNNVSP
jgi:uncharacterized membrane protein YphA (DoxX/SURF4 family)